MNRRKFLSLVSRAVAAVAGGLIAIGTATPSVSAKPKVPNPDGEKLLELFFVSIGTASANANLEIDWYSCFQASDRIVPLEELVAKMEARTHEPA